MYLYVMRMIIARVSSDAAVHFNCALNMHSEKQKELTDLIKIS